MISLELLAVITGIIGLVLTISVYRDVQVIGYLVWVLSNCAWIVLAVKTGDAAHGVLFFIYLLGAFWALYQRVEAQETGE